MSTRGLAALAALVGCVVLAVPARAGLVAHWQLDENDGYVAADTVGGHDGTLTPSDPGGPNWAAGVLGQALDFDGGGDRVETSWEGIAGGAARSVAFWVKTTDTGPTGLVGWGNHTGGGAKWHVRVNDQDGGDPLVGAVRTEVQGGYNIGDVVIADGQWHHVASVLPDDGTPNVEDVVHYVDGVRVGASDINPHSVNTDTTGGQARPVSLGARYQGTWDVVDGVMDDVRVYDHALSDSEVAALAAVSAPSVSGLVAHWKFDDGPGHTTAVDSAGGHTATLRPSTGGPAWSADTAPTGEPNPYALTFDGGDDSAVAADYKGVTGTDPRTVAAWIKTDSNGNQAIASWGRNQNAEKWTFRVQNNNGTNGAIRTEVNGGYVVGNTPLGDGQWHHVASVLPDVPSPNVTDVVLYVDGIPQGLSASQGNPIDTASIADLMIGIDHSNRRFGGSIDDLRVYDRPLSMAEIRELAWAATPPTPYAQSVLDAAPIAYWRMEETSGSELTNLGSLGSGLRATYEADVMLGQPGLHVMHNGLAPRFDGSDAHVYIRDHGAFNDGGPYDARTVELWFQADDVGPRQVLFEEGGHTRGLNVYLMDGSLHVLGWNDADDDGGQTTPWGEDPADPFVLTTPIEADTKYMVNLVLRGDPTPFGFNGTLEGYLNGQLFAQRGGVGQLFSHGDDAGIGAMHQNAVFHDGDSGGNGFWFAGVLDEVALYNLALSQDVIWEHYELGTIPEPATLVLVGGGLVALARRRRRRRGRGSGAAVLLAAVALLGLVGQPASAALLGYWPFEEGSGETTADVAGGYNGSLLPAGSGPAWTPASNPALPTSTQALDFDAVDDYVHTVFPGIGGSGSRTVSFWINTTEVTRHGIVAWGDSGSSGEKWHVRLNDSAGNGVVGAVRTEVQGGYNIADTPLDDGAWHHVVSVFQKDSDPNVNDVDHYVDGVLLGRSGLNPQSVNTDTTSGAAEPVSIGRRMQDSSAHHYRGLIDDVAIWSTALPEEEIQKLATGTSPLDITEPAPRVPVGLRFQGKNLSTDRFWIYLASSNQTDGTLVVDGASGVVTGSMQVPVDETPRYCHVAIETITEDPYFAGTLVAPVGYAFQETGGRYLVTDTSHWRAAQGQHWYDFDFDAVATPPQSFGEETDPAYPEGTERIWRDGIIPPFDAALFSAPFTLEWSPQDIDGEPLDDIGAAPEGLAALIVRTTDDLDSMAAARDALALRPGMATHDMSGVASVGYADLDNQGLYGGQFARLAPDRQDREADPEDYAVLLSGYIHIDSPQTRTFAVTSDDEFELKIGDTELGGGAGVPSPPHMVSVTFPQAGYWPIEVLYRNRGGDAGIEVAVSNDAQAIEPAQWQMGDFTLLGQPGGLAVYERPEGLGDTSDVGANPVGGALWTGSLPDGTTNGDGIWVQAEADTGVGNTNEAIAYLAAHPDAGVTEHRTQVNLLDTGSDGAFGGNERYPGLPSGNNDRISTRCYGLFYSPGDETYAFAVASDDGFRLQLGDRVLGHYNDGRGQNEWDTNFMYAHFPEAGLYPVQVYSYEGSGGAGLEFSHGGTTSLLISARSPNRPDTAFNIDLQNRFYTFEPRARLEADLLSASGAAYVEVPAAGLTLAPDSWKLQRHVTGRYPGLLGSYYTRLGNWSRGSLLGIRHDLVPAGTGIVGGDSPAETQFHFPDNYGYGPWGDREDNLYVEWTGILTIPDGQGGTYRFAEHVDDRARLFIDDMGSALIHDNTWHNYATASIDLAPGEHLFRYIAIEAGGGEFADLFWLPPGTPDPGHPSDWDYVPADFFSFDADLWLTLAEGTGMLGDLMLSEEIATFPYGSTFDLRLTSEFFGRVAIAEGQFTFVPEPASLALLGGGLAALARRRRRAA
ncbi:MAG: LamG-like jellyroll fold domain-containing protein [Candidatus Brocadiia bacterium]